MLPRALPPAAVLGLSLIARESPAVQPYSLLRPKPVDQLRQLAADRPDATESPFTVDPGRFQLELSLFDISHDKAGSDVSTRAIALAPFLLKVGVLENVDLQLGLDPFTNVRQRDRSTAATDRFDGFGDTVVRVKWNLWGNDGGRTAGAVMPFIKIPTATDGLGNDEVEGGVIFPVAVDLAEHWSLGAMAEWDLVFDEQEDDHRSDLVHTAVLGRDLGDRAGLYLEYAGAARLDGGEDYRASINFGGTCALNGNTQLDAGVRLGVTPAAEDVGVFVGMTLRF